MALMFGGIAFSLLLVLQFGMFIVLFPWLIAAYAAGLPTALSPLTIVPVRHTWIERIGWLRLAAFFSTHPPLEQRIARLVEMGASAGRASPVMTRH